MTDFLFHYLDNSATTPVCKEAAEAAYHMMTVDFGNPSSLHTLGFEAEQALSKARRAVATLIGATPAEITFTSGGTEANNLAIFGVAGALARRGRHIVTTAVEHPSVLGAMAELEKQGFSVTYLTPDANGLVTADAVEAACRPDTILVSVMLVNNETGARFPVEAIAAAVHRISPLAKVHTDAVQAAGKLPLRVDSLGVDLLTLSGHKLHAPKGSGALYCRRGCRLLPRTFGGGQENALRPGTEATPAYVALGAALDAAPPQATLTKQFDTLCTHLLTGLDALPDAVLHRPAAAVPYIVNVSLPGLRSETVLHFLAQRQIYVSSGSACAKGKRSAVLTAMGLSDAEIDSAIRISLSRYNDIEDIDALLKGLLEAVATLRRR